ncbi:MAG: hypothetical protein ABSD70_16665 [Terracidiphilus sp.]
MVIQYGLVGNAAHGGHSSSTFDLAVGLGVLVLTWMPRRAGEGHLRMNIWLRVGISAICAVFIFAGVSELLRGR